MISLSIQWIFSDSYFSDCLSTLHVFQPLKAIKIPYFFTVNGLITFDFR